MAGHKDTSAATHFGRQMKRTPRARLVAAGTVHRDGPTTAPPEPDRERATPADPGTGPGLRAAFPERRGWYTDYYDESRRGPKIPPGFRDWSEIEDKAVQLRAWSPGIIHGLLQTEDYAAALTAHPPGASDETIAGRLRARMERQRRVILRDIPPAACFVVDEMALYRLVGTPAVMTAQLRYLHAVAAMPDITIQVLPAIAHPANASGFVIADDAAWCEHVAGGFVYTDQTVRALLRLFDTLRSESFRASETAALLERTAQTWATGASPLTQTPTAETA